MDWCVAHPLSGFMLCPVRPASDEDSLKKSFANSASVRSRLVDDVQGLAQLIGALRRHTRPKIRSPQPN
jgi:hypothetical protein